MNHYFSSDPQGPFTTFDISYTGRGFDLRLKSSAGVFSSKKVDFGTNVLIKNMVIGENDTVLDLGCGIGIVGVIAARLTSNNVYMVDINKRAVKLSKLNSRGLKNVTVLVSDKFSAVENLRFDVILFNPPQTAGKKTCFEMIELSKLHLNENGTLQLVARHNVGGRTLSEKMFEVFGNVETIVKSGGYRVYVSKA
ncbi:MAG: methyltransferase [archaeon]